MKTDNKVLAARHYVPSGFAAEGPDYDIVSLSDVVIAARIGIHQAEQGVTQRVRIGIEVGVVPRTEAYSEEIASVISYDYLLEGIRTITGAGHIRLAETLAERLADWCLADRRAVYARVRVEKLDRLPEGRLGVQILRRQHHHGAVPRPVE